MERAHIRWPDLRCSWLFVSLHVDAAQKGLERAAEDSGVCYTFYLITQLALAARTSDWEGALGEHSIRLSHLSSVFDFTSEVQDAIDRYISQNPSGATDLSEIAQHLGLKR